MKSKTSTIIVNRRIMIIIWRWNELNNTSDWGEYSIEGCSHDKIYIADIKQEDTVNVKKIKEKIVDYLRSENHQVFLFLHRSHGYQRRDIEGLSSYVKKELKYKRDEYIHGKLKFFLFGSSRDYIYFDTANSGLIHGGEFMHEEIYDDKGKLIKRNSVFTNKDKKEIKKSCFDKVWNYYQLEFKKKVFELKEDLFVKLFEQTNNVGEYQLDLEKRQALLMYRLKSFRGLGLSKRERKVLVEAEWKQQRSFIFDDCIENVKNNYGDEALNIHSKITLETSALFNKGNITVPFTEIRTLFDQLLAQMPEKIY